MRNFFALISGGLFGSGLIVAGVTDAYVIHGWLDIFDQWTPQLGFFFVASAGVMAIGWRLAKNQTHSLLGEQMPQIINGKMDFSLVLGSILFGIGWGLAGICPGPSLAALSFWWEQRHAIRWGNDRRNDGCSSDQKRYAKYSGAWSPYCKLM